MAKRKNPVAEFAERFRKGAADADSSAMKRMPQDFRKMHKDRKKSKKRDSA